MIRSGKGEAVLLLALLSLPCQMHAAPPAQFEIDLKELDRQKAPAAPKPEKKAVKKAKPPAASPADKKVEPGTKSGYIRYTVQPGDHIFKILVGELGMSNEAAERLIPEIVRINDIDNIKALKVGKTLLIPTQAKPQRPSKVAKQAKPREKKVATPAETPPPSEAKAAPAAPPAAPAAEPKAEAPLPPAVPETVTWICSVGKADTAAVVDSLLNALSATWSRNKTIQSGAGAATPFSVRVDRHFEFKGGRYIVTLGDFDPYSYTMSRVLETAGYKVLRLNGKEEFRGVAEKLLAMVGVEAKFGGHPLQGGKQGTGFLIRQEDAGGRRVLVTDLTVEPGLKWVLPAGCAAR